MEATLAWKTLGMSAIIAGQNKELGNSGGHDDLPAV